MYLTIQMTASIRSIIICFEVITRRFERNFSDHGPTFKLKRLKDLLLYWRVYLVYFFGWYEAFDFPLSYCRRGYELTGTIWRYQEITLWAGSWHSHRELRARVAINYGQRWEPPVVASGAGAMIRSTTRAVVLHRWENLKTVSQLGVDNNGSKVQ